MKNPSCNNIHYTPSLFDENSLFTPERPACPEYRKENEVKTPLYSPKEIVREEIKYVEVPAKKITEIRIFFDNGTVSYTHLDVYKRQERNQSVLWRNRRIA